MFQLEEKVRIDTALGGTEYGNYKGPLPALKGAHEVWVGGRPSAARIVWHDQVSRIPVTEAPA